MPKFFAEITKDIKTKEYFCNLFIENKLAENLVGPYTDYKTMKEQVRFFTGIELPLKKSLIFTTENKKEFAYVDATQLCSHGSIVTLDEIKAGHKPNWEEVKAEKAKTNLFRATTDPNIAIANLTQAIKMGYNAWIEVQENGNQEFPITIPNPILSDPHNWKSSFSSIFTDKEIANMTFFNKTQRDLFENWTEVSSTKEAAEIYRLTGEITKGLIVLATEKCDTLVRSNIRRADGTEYRKMFHDGDYDYEKTSFKDFWVPKKDIPYYVADENIKEVFVVCYSEKPLNKAANFRKAAEFMLKLAEMEEIKNA